MDTTEKRLSKLLNTLCEVRSLTLAWEALHPNKKAWTRQVSLNAQSGSSHIDHIIVSHCLLQSKAITRMGILQDERVGSSDHRLLVMEYDLAIALNLEDLPHVHGRPKRIDYKNKLQVNNFCDKVMATIPKEQMEREIECLEQISRIPSSVQDGT